jgi:hypothetical protein
MAASPSVSSNGFKDRVAPGSDRIWTLSSPRSGSTAPSARGKHPLDRLSLLAFPCLGWLDVALQTLAFTLFSMSASRFLYRLRLRKRPY